MSKPLGRLLRPLACACAAMALSLSVVQPAWADGAVDQPQPSQPASSSPAFGGPLAVLWCADPQSVQSGGTFTVGIWSLDRSQALSSVAFTLNQGFSFAVGQNGNGAGGVQGRSDRSHGSQARADRSGGNQNNGNQNDGGQNNPGQNPGGQNNPGQNPGGQNNPGQNPGGQGGNGDQNPPGTSLTLTTDSLAQGAPACANPSADGQAQSAYGVGQWWTATVSVPDVQSDVQGYLAATVVDATGRSGPAISLLPLDVQPGQPINQLPEAPYAAIFPAILLAAFGVSRRRRRRNAA
jgi:hypothetical protein